MPDTEAWNDIAAEAGVDRDAEEAEAQEAKQEKGSNQATQLVELVERLPGAALYRAEDDRVIIHFPEDEGIPAADYFCPSRALERRLLHLFKTVVGKLPGRDTAKSAMAYLDAKGMVDANTPVRRVYVRHGWITDDSGDPTKAKIYIDLCERNNRRAIEIQAGSWKLVDDPPIFFMRPEGMQPLPEPITNTKHYQKALTRLRKLLRLTNDDDWTNLLLFIMSTLSPFSLRMILYLGGVAGGGKTSTMRMIRYLLDPSLHSEAIKPQTLQDFYVLAQHAYLVCLDNLSDMGAKFSDALCCLATGVTMTKRALYTNDELHNMRLLRPVVLTSIENRVWREDVGSRMLSIYLPSIDQRIGDTKLMSEGETLRPHVLGAFCTAAAHALANYKPSSTLNHRMQSLIDWFEATAPALNVTHDRIADSLKASAIDLAHTHLEASPIVEPLRRWAIKEIEDGSGLLPEAHTISLSTSELFARLDGIATPTEMRQEHWPRNSRSLGHKLADIQESIKHRGIRITRFRQEHCRGWRIDFSELAERRRLPTERKRDDGDFSPEEDGTR